MAYSTGRSVTATQFLVRSTFSEKKSKKTLRIVKQETVGTLRFLA